MSMSRFAFGLKCFLRGVSWLKSRPLIFILLYVPMILGAALTFSALGLYFSNFEKWMDFILFDKPETLLGMVGYWLSYVSAVLGIILVGVLAGVLLPSIIASPFYDYVSIKVEKDLTGGTSYDISFTKALLLMGEEIKKALFILFVSIVAIFIPFLNLLVPAWLIAWEFYDYPVARRGLGFSERLQGVRKDFWKISGFSVWFMIPFIQFLLMPLAVAGGTMLAVESLEDKED